MPRRLPRSLVVSAVALVAAVAAAGAPSARGETGAPSAAPSAAAPRVTFVAGPGGSVIVHGTYPTRSSPCVHPIAGVLHARFGGTIEVGVDGDGRLFVIGQLPFEQYVDGIAEVPRTWPMEALRAQAVAARSYALAHMGYPDPTGERLGYQLCATDACQVYRGLGVSEGPYGSRWRRAVSSTAGQVLLYEGRPADALYFSTSNGHTVGNEDVFGTAPLPYLRPVIERDDGASPLSHWRSELPLGDVTRFLRAGGHWGTGDVTSVSRADTTIVLGSSAAPTVRRLSLSTFRDDLNYWPACLDPGRYPGINHANGTALPQVVPSQWFTLSTAHGDAVLDGRGWGHGVGMVQWGAEGKAARGLSYSDILAAYYGGLRPAHDDEPADIRIGIAVGLEAVTVEGVGPVSVSGTGVGRGPWAIAGGRSLSVRTGRPPPTFVTAGRLSHAPRHARAGNHVDATLLLPQLAVVRLALVDGGREIDLTPPQTFPAGTVHLRGLVPASVTGGSYRLEAVVSDGVDFVRTPSRVVAVAGPAATPAPSTSAGGSAAHAPVASAPASHGRGLARVAAALAAVVVAIVIASLVLVRRRRRRARTADALTGS